MIRYVEINDKKEWYDLDRHLPENVFDEKVRTKQGYVLVEDGKIIGILRYNLFWDNTPFCTMLFINSKRLFINSKREYSVFFKAGMNRTNGL